MRPVQFKPIPGSICAPLGFKTAAVFCDIKKLGTGKGSEKGRKDDLALIVSDVPAAVAAMFTTNQMRAAPVRVSAKHAANFARAIVINSGNANACTGAQGLRDAEKMCALAADAVAAVYDRRTGSGVRTKNSALIERRYRRITARDVLVCSTGRIGLAMPMKNVARGIRECAPLLARSSANAQATAGAIMTSDTCRKEIAVEFQVGKLRARIGGICKGAGMIEPRMSPQATMLAFITTDVAISPTLLKRALKVAVEQSFNRISVDGDLSTNDTVLVLANGLAGNPPIGRARLSRAGNSFDGSRGLSPYQKFQGALNHVTLELAKMIVRDGEGVSRFITLRVNGAKSAHDAETVARAIANSALVKTSWCGGDPNWGRILCAIGYANAKVNEAKIDIGYSRPDQREIVFGFQRGKPTQIAFTDLTAITSEPEFDVHINLRAGKHATSFYTCDLTEDYVAFNKGDITDPTTLGG
jgi:glutamate N-acetyltransferase/amino-acid N-acetyltransferase